jgi:hypothetical protein
VQIWAITSYFNPSGYAIRLHNFKKFHTGLGLPLVAVELVFPGEESELAPYLSRYGPHKVIHVVIRQGDVMWQKERLLNVALSRTPREATHVVWIDGDAVFPDLTWIDHLAEKLRTCPIVQCFGKIRCLPSNEKSVWASENSSFVYRNLHSEFKPGGAHGLVWAGHADFLRRHGFYDARIVGGGDLAFAYAAMGFPMEWGNVNFRRHFTPNQISHYESWAKPFYDELSSLGSVGCLDDVVYHLWHGEETNRQYNTRWRVLVDHAFDPNCDIRVNVEGSWSWNSDKPKMHKAMLAYFQERQEDADSSKRRTF